MSAIAPAIPIPLPTPTGVLAGLATQLRRAFHIHRTEGLEDTVTRSLEKAFRQFGRELEG